jgi:hypothetical protein
VVFGQTHVRHGPPTAGRTPLAVELPSRLEDVLAQVIEVEERVFHHWEVEAHLVPDPFRSVAAGDLFLRPPESELHRVLPQHRTERGSRTQRGGVLLFALGLVLKGSKLHFTPSLKDVHRGTVHHRVGTVIALERRRIFLLSLPKTPVYPGGVDPGDARRPYLAAHIESAKLHRPDEQEPKYRGDWWTKNRRAGARVAGQSATRGGFA